MLTELEERNAVNFIRANGNCDGFDCVNCPFSEINNGIGITYCSYRDKNGTIHDTKDKGLVTMTELWLKEHPVQVISKFIHGDEVFVSNTNEFKITGRYIGKKFKEDIWMHVVELDDGSIRVCKKVLLVSEALKEQELQELVEMYKIKLKRDSDKLQKAEKDLIAFRGK